MIRAVMLLTTTNQIYLGKIHKLDNSILVKPENARDLYPAMHLMLRVSVLLLSLQSEEANNL